MDTNKKDLLLEILEKLGVEGHIDIMTKMQEAYEKTCEEIVESLRRQVELAKSLELGDEMVAATHCNALLGWVDVILSINEQVCSVNPEQADRVNARMSQQLVEMLAEKFSNCEFEVRSQEHDSV